MKCEVCGKKKATVHLTELIDEQVSELHICEDCAREKSVQMEQQFGLADLLAGLSDFGKPTTEKPAQKPKAVQCSNCQTTYEEFKKHGRLGCSDCYQAFQHQLGSLLKKIHGANRHMGKISKQCMDGGAATGFSQDPQDQSDSSGVEALREELQQAVLCEDYERAAELRDQIRAMEQEQEQEK